MIVSIFYSFAHLLFSVFFVWSRTWRCFINAAATTIAVKLSARKIGEITSKMVPSLAPCRAGGRSHVPPWKRLLTYASCRFQCPGQVPSSFAFGSDATSKLSSDFQLLTQLKPSPAVIIRVGILGPAGYLCWQSDQCLCFRWKFG
jgi:hypothetical protein